MSELNWGRRACTAVLLCATTAIALPAQTQTSPRCTASTARTAATPWARWFRPPMGTSTGQPTLAGPTMLWR